MKRIACVSEYQVHKRRVRERGRREMGGGMRKIEEEGGREVMRERWR